VLRLLERAGCGRAGRQTRHATTAVHLALHAIVAALAVALLFFSQLVAEGGWLIMGMLTIAGRTLDASDCRPML